MFFKITSVVVDAIRMFKSSQKANFFENVLPLFQRLFPAVGHLLDGHDLGRDIVARIVDRAKGPVSDLAEVVEQLVRVFAFEQLRHIRIL